MLVLDEDTWRARAKNHAERADRLLGDVEERRRKGIRHPVQDFLFDYYSFRPGRLRQWHPGFGVFLAGDTAEWLTRRGYETVQLPTTAGVIEAATVAQSERLRLSPVVDFVSALLHKTAQRPAQFGCFGLHEWAMVYGQDPEEVRHAAWPLRTSPEQVRGVVDGQGLRCTHFDAYRFYTDQARPLNTHVLTRESRISMEQPGCLHANMDLYKWAYKLTPLLPSEFTLDAFALACRIRELDMRAAPYDLRELGYEPVPVERPEGRAVFAKEQRQHAEQAAALRADLIDLCRKIGCSA